MRVDNNTNVMLTLHCCGSMVAEIHNLAQFVSITYVLVMIPCRDLSDIGEGLGGAIYILSNRTDRDRGSDILFVDNIIEVRLLLYLLQTLSYVTELLPHVF